MTQEVGRSFWLHWTLASLGSWVAGAFIGQLVSEIGGMVVGMALAGALVGAVQWLLLQQWLNGAGWWVAATAAGVALAGLVAGVQVWVQVVEPGPLVFVALQVASLEHALTGGLIPGLLQWLVLRRLVYRAGWWPVGSGLAWAAGVLLIGWLTTDLLSNIMAEGLDAYEAIVVGMTAAAALQAPLLAWLLQRPRPEAQVITSDRWGSYFSQIVDKYRRK